LRALTLKERLPGFARKRVSVHLAETRREVPQNTVLRRKREQPPAGGNAPVPPAGPAAQDEDNYPELILHGYPGISRAELFADAQQAVSSLGGWKITNVDRNNGALDCVYTSRILRSEDDIRIVVTTKNRVFVCSRSNSRWFPGDFGANIGHIKEFQQAVEPAIDKFYKELENRMRGQDNGQRS